MILSRLCRIEASDEFDPLWTKTGDNAILESSVGKNSNSDKMSKRLTKIKYFANYYTTKSSSSVQEDQNNYKMFTSVVDYESIIKLLYDYGADINKTDNPDHALGYAPLHYAANYGNVNRIEWLLHRGAKIDVVDTNVSSSSATSTSSIASSASFTKITPLMLACQNGHLRAVHALLSYNANILAKASNGYTMLHFASMSGVVILLEFLMECGLDKNALSNDGKRPVDVSKECGYHSCTQIP